MTKVIKIPTSKITQFETKQIPTIEQENKIFKKDNIGTVVPGDALRNINLSTVPSVIQDAINAMGLSVETNILANALLLQIQRDIDNLGDAIVEKSYIDGQVSYLTSLLGQKSDTGDVASIVDSRIAIVTEDFATTAQVNNLNSRVGESESSITTLNQTINTKDAARATQIEEVEARVNQSLSNYTAVLNLTVDENGNVISQKIESLVAQNEEVVASIEDLNQVIIDKDNEWSAKSIKLITSPTGAITGYSFQDGSGLKSTFEINADNFKIANSYNTYTPFSISGTSLYFNGKVAFTNITGTSDLVSTSNIQNAITNNVTTIDGGKIVTNQAFVNNLNAVGGIKASKIDVNNGNGFILNSEATGTSSSPNIQGGYIKGAILEGTALTVNDVKVKANGYPNNFGSLLLFYKNIEYGKNIASKTVMSQNFIARSSGTGYNKDRMCATNVTFTISVEAQLSLVSGMDYVSGYLQYSTDNGSSWSTLQSYGSSYMFVGGVSTYIANSLYPVQFKFVGNNNYPYTNAFKVGLEIIANNYE